MINIMAFSVPGISNKLKVISIRDNDLAERSVSVNM